jgi:hypothetical protein
MKTLFYSYVTIFLLFVLTFNEGYAQTISYSIYATRYRNFNNNCDGGWLGDEEGRFFPEAFDDVLGWTGCPGPNVTNNTSAPGGTGCDGNANGGGYFCDRNRLLRNVSNTTSTRFGLFMSVYEDDGVTSWDCGLEDCGSNATSYYYFNSYPQCTDNNIVLGADGRYEITFRMNWRYTNVVRGTLSANTYNICAGSSVNFTITGGTPGNRHRTWMGAVASVGSTGLISGWNECSDCYDNQNSFSRTFNTPGVYLIRTHPRNCADEWNWDSYSDIWITVNPNPTVNPGGAMLSICQGGTSAGLGGSVGGGATGGTWSTAVGGTFSPSATALNATWAPPAGYSGTATLTLTTSGGSCGTVSANKNITVNPSPTVNPGGAMSAICQGGTSAGLGGSVGGGATGGTWSTPVGGTFSPSATALNATWAPPVGYNGTATLTLTTSGGACGTASANKNIIVNSNNTVGLASSSPTVCTGTAITPVTHTTTGATGIGVASGLPTGITASWSSNTVTISGTPGASGTFNYTIPLTGGCGSVNATGTIIVNARPMPTYASVSPTANVCRGTEVTYTTQSGQSNYVWSIPGTAGVDYVLASGGSSASNTATISWLAAGSGTVVLVNYQNGAGCAAASPANSPAVTLPLAALSLSTNGQSATCRVNGSRDISFVNGTNLLLSLRSGGNIDLGDVTATSYTGTTGTMQACGTSIGEPQFMAAYLGRRWVVQAPSAPASPAVVATLPFTSGELSSLAITSATVTTANPFDDVNASNNGSDLILVKHTSGTEDGDPTNNCGSGTTVAVTSPVLGTVLGNPYVQFSFTGFSEWYLHGESKVSPLPIVLASFTESCIKGQVQLDWETATEINNEKFIIDRSVDMQSWEPVITKAGAGNSNQLLAYQGIDARPLQGLSYYRLTQRDYDGASETFTPVSVTCYTDGNGNSMMVYPNPTDDKFTVNIHLVDACNDCSIEINDLNGKRITSQNISMEKGGNTYTFDRASMSPGQYIIQLKSGDFVVKPVKLIIR